MVPCDGCRNVVAFVGAGVWCNGNGTGACGGDRSQGESLGTGLLGGGDCARGVEDRQRTRNV